MGVRTLREQVKTVNEATRGITDNLDGRLKKLEREMREDLDALEVSARPRWRRRRWRRWWSFSRWKCCIAVAQAQDGCNHASQAKG